MNINYKNYTNATLRMPPKNVKVMMVFDDGSKDICFIDAWNVIHGEKERIIRGREPAWWKKLEKDNWGEYVW